MTTGNELLSHPHSPIVKIFNFEVAKQLPDQEKRKTLEKRALEQISIDPSPEFHQRLARLCKTGITNLILENYKRKKKDFP